jgi:DNA-binding response OmpR family regulator
MSDDPSQGDAATKPIRALLIEDEAAIVRMVRLILSMEPDFELTSAESGTEGLRLAVPGMVDLVLLDLHLDDVDGETMLGKLQGLLPAPVVVFSASSEKEVAESCMAAGAAAFIAKPFDPDTLAARLRKVVGRS